MKHRAFYSILLLTAGLLCLSGCHKYITPPIPDEDEERQQETVWTGVSSGTMWELLNCGTNKLSVPGAALTWNQAQTVLTAKESIPTKSQVEELLAGSRQEPTSIHGTEGYLVTFPNGATLFFPLGNYWTSTPAEEGMYVLAVTKDGMSLQTAGKDETCYLRCVTFFNPQADIKAPENGGAADL